jgi:hypothetical protein
MIKLSGPHEMLFYMEQEKLPEFITILLFLLYKFHSNPIHL